MSRSALIIVCNGAQFIEAQIRHIYDMVDDIVIVEGADKVFSSIIGSRRSTDGTLAIIKRLINTFDTKNKIKLIHECRDKNAMVRAGNAVCEGDFIYHVDIDEFMKHDIIDEAFQLLNIRSGVSIPQRWYYKWPDRYISSGRKNSIQFVPVRFYRNRLDEGLYVHHIPPGFYYNPKTKKTLPIDAAKLPFNKYAHHFLALFQSQVSAKMQYYHLRDSVPLTTVNKRMAEFKDATREVGYEIPSYKGELLKEKHPMAIKKGKRIKLL